MVIKGHQVGWHLHRGLEPNHLLLSRRSWLDASLREDAFDHGRARRALGGNGRERRLHWAAALWHKLGMVLLPIPKGMCSKSWRN
jgi:hypothetical protein